MVGDLIYEDTCCSVVLHEDWAVLGHAMVIWNAHVENVGDLTSEEARSFASIHRAAERALLEATGAERAILLKLGIQTPHLHLHIYPMPAAATRIQVFEAFDGKTRVERDDAFVERVRALLLTHCHG